MNSDDVIKYTPPEMWIHYDIQPILDALVEAKAAIKSLQAIPSQKSWTEALQVVQLKLEIEGTSRIEGADFTGTELEIALRETEEQLRTRSQRQAKAAQRAYAWIAQQASDFPVSCDTILHIHLLIVENADDDHCIPGALRTRDENVIFGSPRHRGVNGGEECEREFNAYCAAIQGEFQEHEPLVRALAAHYHLAAMHPFLDGNGRTARALEAFLLARAGLRPTLFIAMSNYYYEEKQRYLETLASVRAKNHDLTDFLAFGLKGVAQQCGRLFDQINTNVRKALFENMMSNLYNRLLSTRKRGLGERQLALLHLLLEQDLTVGALMEKSRVVYHLKQPIKAFRRDIVHLLRLNAIGWRKYGDTFEVFVRLDWPTEITETEFFKQIEEMPRAQSYPFLE